MFFAESNREASNRVAAVVALLCIRSGGEQVLSASPPESSAARRDRSQQTPKAREGRRNTACGTKKKACYGAQSIPGEKIRERKAFAHKNITRTKVFSSTEQCVFAKKEITLCAFLWKDSMVLLRKSTFCYSIRPACAAHPGVSTSRR